jgi:glycosyltransferase involved in cell wall biosynthesis
MDPAQNFNLRPNPMRVLQVTPYYAPAWGYGGVVEAVFQLTRHLGRAGTEVRVLTSDANGEHRRLTRAAREAHTRNTGIETVYCRRRAAESAAPAMLARLPALIRWADLVHLHAVYSFPAIPTLAYARVLGRPVVWTPRGALQRWPGSRRVALKSVWEKICGAIAPRRMTLHLTSDQEASESSDRFAGAARVVIPNGVEIPRHVDRAELAGRLRIGFIGRIDPKKGIENLLDACAILAARGTPECSLSIAGGGLREYRDRIVARVTGRVDVTMSGEVRDEEKERWFASQDVVVVPSYTENFANVIAEALARAVPVIASRATPWTALETRGCGLWVANDPASLADAIQRIAAMPLAEMGARGRDWMIERYSWERCARDMIRCYENLLGIPGIADAPAADRAQGAI